jgi:hypothetical protein
VSKTSDHRLPLAIDLFCGLGGWTEGLLAEGYRVIGFDIEQHVYGEHRYPAQLVLQDVRTLHGRQFKDAALIVASPPCQAYSWRAMPWKAAKAAPPPSNELFEACFLIQREASKAAGRHVPMVVENVRGAQKWVGRARWNYGSYYLWGDVPALMPIGRAVKVSGLNWSGSTRPGYVARAFNTTAEQRSCRAFPNEAADWKQAHSHDGVKSPGVGALGWGGGRDVIGRTSSGSKARARASAMIAKIPLPLARHVGRVWHPGGC